MMQRCLVVMENSIYQIKINPKKSSCTWDTQCITVSYKTAYMQVQAKPKYAKIHKHWRQAVKKKSMGIDLVFITGANASVRVTALYATRKLQKFTVKRLPAYCERSFLRWIDRMQRYSLSVLICMHSCKEMQRVIRALHLRKTFYN